jgi:AcrR family transcriptional regulator
MRVKTQDRRDAIIQAAMAVFSDVGFERASMSEIALRVGGSKATLYGYFASKEELYVAAMQEAIAAQAGEISRILDPAQTDVRAVLEGFGIACLEKVTSPDILASKRTMISQGGASSLAAELYEHVERYVWTPVAAYLRTLMDRGDLRRADPRIAAYHLQGLLDAGVIEPSLHGVAPRLTIEHAVPLAVDAFLRIYGAAPATR